MTESLVNLDGKISQINYVTRFAEWLFVCQRAKTMREI